MNNSFKKNHRQHQTIVVAIPCLNEAATIGKVVHDFKQYLPEARIIVFDNNSTDRTATIAQQSGAEVFQENKPGKGNVIRAIFARVKADIYVLVDGDDTYPANEISKLIAIIVADKADMVVGTRLHNFNKESLRLLHNAGNLILLKIMNLCFRVNLSDILSGYRVINKKVIEKVPLFANGFEIETELTIQALIHSFRITEVPVSYRARPPQGGKSKIKPFRDGYQILMTIIFFTRDYKPMLFFPAVSLILIAGSLLLGYRVTAEYWQTGLIRYLPSAVLATGLMLLGVFFFLSGFIIHTINRRFNEMNYLLKRYVANHNDSQEKSQQ
jgi:glycosyltransferase involved in cell wall biosynthesis